MSEPPGEGEEEDDNNVNSLEEVADQLLSSFGKFANDLESSKAHKCKFTLPQDFPF